MQRANQHRAAPPQQTSIHAGEPAPHPRGDARPGRVRYWNEVDQATYGPSNAEVARAMFGLGGAQSLEGDLNAALATYQHALDIAGAAMGEQDPWC